MTHTYNRAGRLLTTTDAAGLLTRTYAHGILTDETYTGPGHLAGQQITRSLDSLHRLSSLSVPSVYSVGHTYDNAGRLSTVSEGFHLASYGYKANVGSVESVAIKRLNVERVKHTRQTDALGRVTQVKSASGSTVHVQRDYTYNAANQRVQIAHEDTRQWTYGYDSLGQVTSAQKRLADGTTPLPGYSFGYAFDTIGNRTATTVNGRSAAYSANPLNQYTSRTVHGALDVTGEARTDATVTVDALPTTRTAKDFYRERTLANTAAPVSDSVTIEATVAGPPPATVTEERSVFLPQTPESYTHDADGNLTGDGRWTYVYDAENRLVLVETQPAVATAFPALKCRLEFACDAQGRRIRKVVKDWNLASGLWSLASDTRFLYDGWNLAAELDALNGNKVLRSYVWGLDLSETMQGAGGVGGLLWANVASETLPVTYSFAPNSDAGGNIVAWVNTATLAVAGRADYAAFGEPVMQTGVARELPFGFSSKYTDHETGHLYYGHRYLNVSTGRWTSRDPIEERGGLNLYGMVGNNPVNHWDRLGLETGDLWAGILNENRCDCIIDGIAYSREKQGTGIKRCTGYTYDTPIGIGKWLITHDYIMVDGVGYGFYSAHHMGLSESPYGDLYSDGYVVSDDHVRYPENPLAGSQTYAKCAEVKLSPCDYDIEKFTSCVKSKAGKHPDRKYMLTCYNCEEYADGIISSCMQEAKRK